MNNSSRILEERLRPVVDAVHGWFARPASPAPLGVFRIGIAVTLLVQAWGFAEQLDPLFGREAVVQAAISEGMSPPALPRVAWLASAFGDQFALRLTFAAYVAALLVLGVGAMTRAAAVAAWLSHAALVTTGAGSCYGADAFAHIALFYCAVMPVGEAFSIDVASARASGKPSAEARIALRVLQLHLCVVYLASGIEKGTGSQWWTGEALWRALMRPDLGQYDFSWLASVPWIARAATVGTLAVEVGYAFGVWQRRTRPFTVAAVIAMHVGIALFMGLHTFAMTMIVLNVAAFLVPCDHSHSEAHCDDHALRLTPPGVCCATTAASSS